MTATEDQGGNLQRDEAGGGIPDVRPVHTVCEVRDAECEGVDRRSGEQHRVFHHGASVRLVPCPVNETRARDSKDATARGVKTIKVE
jgi:hypothetical protein